MLSPNIMLAKYVVVTVTDGSVIIPDKLTGYLPYLLPDNEQVIGISKGSAGSGPVAAHLLGKVTGEVQLDPC